MTCLHHQTIISAESDLQASGPTGDHVIPVQPPESSKKQEAQLGCQVTLRLQN